MDKVIYFDEENCQSSLSSNQIYYDFLDYAFERTDYFMLVYVNYYSKGYSKEKKFFKNSLKPYQIKSRSNPSWPGTLSTFCPNTTYKIVFYRNTLEAKELLKRVDKISDWSPPFYPEDLAFFCGNQCWFYSVGHEKIAGIIHASNEDIAFLEKKGISSKEKAFISQDNFFDNYDEMIEEL